MKSSVLSLVSVACVALGSGCDLASAGSGTITKWVSKKAGLVLAFEQKGDKYLGECYLLSDGLQNMPEDKLVEVGDILQGSMYFVTGLRKSGSKTMLFPLKKNTMAQVGSVDHLVDSGHPYIEVELNLEADHVVGKWRTGKKRPQFTRKFLRCQ